MRIDQLQLKNFRKFEELTLNLHPRLTLLVGANGSGKTSVLDGLSVAIGSWLLGLSRFSDACKSRSIHKEELRLKFYENEARKTYSYLYQCPSVVGAKGEIQGQKMEWIRTLESVKGRTTRGGAARLKAFSERAGRKVLLDQEVTLPLLSYYGTGRVWQQPNDLKRRRVTANTKEKKSPFEGYRNSHDPRADAKGLFQWIQTQQYISLEEGATTVELSAVRKAILSCIEGGQKMSFSVKLADLIIGIKGQGRQPFNNLSEGYRNMVAMVGDIAHKAVTLNPHLGASAPFKTPGIVLIDEIDLHLHPTWQRTVIGSLQKNFPAIQFVCTTHSPQIISEVPAPKDASVVLLKSEEPPVYVQQSEGMDSNWILRHLMGAAERPGEMTKALSDLDKLIEDREYEKAKEDISKLEKRYGGFAELDERRAIIDQIELLAQ